MNEILVDLRKLSTKPSGIGYYIYSFVKYMMKMDEIKVYGITDVLISNEIKELKLNGLVIYEYGVEVSKSIQVFKYNKFIKRVINRGKFNYFWQPNFIIPKGFNNFQETKNIITIHDISPVIDKEFYSKIYRIYFKIFLNRSIKASDIILYDSKFSKESTENNFTKAKNKKNIVTYIPFKREDGIHKQNDNNYFLYIGNVEKRKGVHLLIDAYTRYLELGGEKDLLIAGGLRDKSINKKIELLNSRFHKKITYLGYIDENKKLQLINDSTAVVFPSFSEGFGIPPLETIFMNKKTIVSNISVLKEVLEDGAMYFDLNVKDYAESVENLVNALMNISNFNIDYEKILNLEEKYNYENIVKNFLNILWDFRKRE